MQDEADAQLKWIRENMSDAIPDEAFPERLNIFRRDRRMTCNDHVNRDPVDWCDYIRKDIADAAVKAERERIATMIEATSYTVNGAVRSLEPVSPAFVGMDMHHATIAAAIRKGEQP
jgi:hypothetical protein